MWLVWNFLDQSMKILELTAKTDIMVACILLYD